MGGSVGCAKNPGRSAEKSSTEKSLRGEGVGGRWARSEPHLDRGC